MSALASPVPSTGRARFRLRGLTWLVWRQNRGVFRFWIVVFLAVTGYLVYWHATAQPMLDDDGTTVGPPPDVGISAASLLVFLAPVLAGVGFGAQLFEREYTEGTYRLACTQSVSAVAWVRAKLCVSAVMVLLCVTPCAAALTWDFRKDPDRQQNWHGLGVFDTIGPAAVAICLLGLFLGAAAGLAWRRGGPAKALVLLLVFTVKAGLFQVLPHLLPASVATSALTLSPQVPQNAWVLKSGFLAAATRQVAAPAGCSGSAVPVSGAHNLCDTAGLVGQYTTYLPYSDLQSLQWIVTGFCVIVCAALALFCMRLIRHLSSDKVW